MLPQSTQYKDVYGKENSSGSSSTFRQWYFTRVRLWVDSAWVCADL